MAQLVKVCVTGPDGLSSIPGTYLVEGENGLSCSVPYFHRHTASCTQTHTHKCNLNCVKFPLSSVQPSEFLYSHSL